MSKNKKTYFASDFHLGSDARCSSAERERQIVRWLTMVAEDAAAIYLVGDVFDFWFDFKRVVPKGYVRFFGKLAELRDQGIPIYFFTGNHDIWMFHYFEEEFDIPIYRQPILRNIHGKQFFIGHGDGLGPGDQGYKFLKKIFTNSLAQWLYARLHPNFSIWLASFFSGRSREAQVEILDFLGADKEWLIAYCEEKIIDLPEVDYFVFGHRHLPIRWRLKNKKTVYINLGDWLQHNTYGVFDGNEFELKTFEHPTLNKNQLQVDFYKQINSR